VADAALEPAARPAPAGRWRQRLAWILLTPLLVYAAAIGYLWAEQERFIFPVRPLNPAQASEILAAFPAARSVRIVAGDGTRLHAWYRPAVVARQPRRALIYFGASREQVYWQLTRRAPYDGWDLLLVEYRGYGLSEGQPGQAALQADALQWLALVRHGDEVVKPAGTVVVMGTSLGSHLATYLAANQPVEGVVLVVPADSVRGLVQAMLPVLPTVLLRHPFDSLASAPRVHAPTIFFVAMHDKLVSVERARRLYDAWGSARREWVELPEANHYTASADPRYWQRLGAFLDGF
jgi:pimeloyl-ACP methyl ester carboxylesterase